MAEIAIFEAAHSDFGRNVLAGISLSSGFMRTMVRLDKPQRTALSETIRALANLVAAAFVLGQLVGERPFSWSLALTGTAAWIALVGFGLVLERSQR